MITEQTIRVVMAVESVTAMLLLGALAGAVWRVRGWGIRVTLIGGFGLLMYVALGQGKALDRGTPVDAVTHVGLTALTLTVIGLLWVLRETSHGRR